MPRVIVAALRDDGGKIVMDGRASDVAERYVSMLTRLSGTG